MRELRSGWVRGTFGTAALVVAAVHAWAAPISWVDVGHPNNAGDDDDGNPATYDYGSVGYSYRISKHEVTNAQYVEFLNAKAQVVDPAWHYPLYRQDTLRLYSNLMTTDMQGGIDRTGTGTSVDPFVYSVQAGEGEHPVTQVTWYDAIRFAN